MKYPPVHEFTFLEEMWLWGRNERSGPQEYFDDGPCWDWNSGPGVGWLNGGGHGAEIAYPDGSGFGDSYSGDSYSGDGQGAN